MSFSCLLIIPARSVVSVRRPASTIFKCQLAETPSNGVATHVPKPKYQEIKDNVVLGSPMGTPSRVGIYFLGKRNGTFAGIAQTVENQVEKSLGCLSTAQTIAATNPALARFEIGAFITSV